MFVAVARTPRRRAGHGRSVEFAKTPALGVMVVIEDNRAGAPQARLIEAGGSNRDVTTATRIAKIPVAVSPSDIHLPTAFSVLAAAARTSQRSISSA